jgi:uncharacterized protein YjbJ (UPF0337 family)
MNKEILKGKWLRIKSDVSSRWGRLTDDEVDQIQGDAEKFIGKLQERYGYRRDQAETELNEFLRMSDNQRRYAA